MALTQVNRRVPVFTCKEHEVSLSKETSALILKEGTRVRLQWPTPVCYLVSGEVVFVDNEGKRQLLGSEQEFNVVFVPKDYGHSLEINFDASTLHVMPDNSGNFVNVQKRSELKKEKKHGRSR